LSQLLIINLKSFNIDKANKYTTVKFAKLEIQSNYLYIYILSYIIYMYIYYLYYIYIYIYKSHKA